MSKKIAHSFRIKEMVRRVESGGFNLYPSDPSIEPQAVSDLWVSRHQTTVGHWYVRYDNGASESLPDEPSGYAHALKQEADFLNAHKAQTRAGLRFVKEFPAEEPIVTMLEHQGRLYMATTKRIFSMVDDEMRPVKMFEAKEEQEGDDA